MITDDDSLPSRDNMPLYISNTNDFVKSMPDGNLSQERNIQKACALKFKILNELHAGIYCALSF